MPAMKKKLMVSYVGDTNDPNTFGGLPWHLVEAGRSLGLVEKGLSAQASQRSVRIGRYAWNAMQVIKGGRYGGFQYTDTFLEKLWRSDPDSMKGYPTLNIFQLYPKRVMESDSQKYFYLDQTILDVFDYYATGATMPDGWKKQVLARERLQYLAADRVIFRSHWAADRAKLNYDLPSEKVAVALPGANIPQSALAAFDATIPVSTPTERELNLVFVGRAWKRKGLDRLLRAMCLAKAEGARISLTIAGVSSNMIPAQYADGLSIKWLGLVDKSQDPLGFVNMLARHDIGVLLSRSEAGGVSLREFGRAGLPVIAPNTGGSPEFAMSDTAILFSPDDSDEIIAEALIDLAADRHRIEEMKRHAWARRHLFDWRATVKQLSCLL